MPTSSNSADACAAVLAQSSAGEPASQSPMLSNGAPQAVAGYTPFTDLGGASPHEAEILAFGLCNTRLANARDTVSRIQALHKNQQLWSMLVRDLASEGNALPDELKHQLIDLGFWAMRYGMLAISQDLPLQPLIGVNRNILEGLRAQTQSGRTVARQTLHSSGLASRIEGGFIASA